MDKLLCDKIVPPTLYRLIDNNKVEFDGDKYCDLAFLSCTDDIDNFILKTDLTDHLACFIIKMKSPFSCINVGELLSEYATEGEYILPRNTMMQLVGIETYDGIEAFDVFLDNLNSVTGSKELWAHGIRIITLYTLEIV